MLSGICIPCPTIPDTHCSDFYHINGNSDKPDHTVLVLCDWLLPLKQSDSEIPHEGVLFAAG